jgi:hypothetical protein
MYNSINDLEKEIEIVLTSVSKNSKSIMWGKIQILSMIREREEFFKNRMEKLIKVLEDVK